MEVSLTSTPPVPFFEVSWSDLVLTRKSGARSLRPLVAPLPMLSPAAPGVIEDPGTLELMSLASYRLDMSLEMSEGGLATLTADPETKLHEAQIINCALHCKKLYIGLDIGS